MGRKKKFKIKEKTVISETASKLKELPKIYNVFETTNKEIVNKLVAKGFNVVEVRSPFGERKDKLYVFQETEDKVNEALGEGK